MKPLFDNTSNLVGWIVPGNHIFDTNMNWVAVARNFDAAFELLQGCLEGNLRCIVAYVHLGLFRMGSLRDTWFINAARKCYEAAVKVGELALPPDFDGVLPL